MSTNENVVLTFAGGTEFFNNQGFWIYINSLIEHVTNADFVILTHEMPDSVRSKLESKNFKVEQVKADVQFLYRDRHLCFYNFFNKHGRDYKRAMVTDCRDVVFQLNPFDWLERTEKYFNSITYQNHYVVLTYEGFAMKQSGFACIEDFEFQRDVPRPFLKEDRERWVINGGIALGTPQALQSLHYLIWSLTLKSIGRCTDQATFNWLSDYFSGNASFLIDHPQAGNLCLTGEGVKEGCVEPILMEGRLCNTFKQTYYMVHQWDRLDYLREEIIAKYGDKN